MSAIGPGDWVECVDASPVSGYPPTGLVVGMLYQVKEALIDWDGDPVLLLVGFRHEGRPNHPGWFVGRFKPVYRPKADLIESLKTPAKRERAPA